MRKEIFQNDTIQLVCHTGATSDRDPRSRSRQGPSQTSELANELASLLARLNETRIEARKCESMCIPVGFQFL